jgi:hypothetical protein
LIETWAGGPLSGEWGDVREVSEVSGSLDADVGGVRVSQLKAKKKKEAALEADKRKAQEDKVRHVRGCMGEGVVVEPPYK